MNTPGVVPSIPNAWEGVVEEKRRQTRSQLVSALDSRLGAAADASPMPDASALRTARSVFSGATAEAPRCPMILIFLVRATVAVGDLDVASRSMSSERSSASADAAVAQARRRPTLKAVRKGQRPTLKAVLSGRTMFVGGRMSGKLGDLSSVLGE